MKYVMEYTQSDPYTFTNAKLTYSYAHTVTYIQLHNNIQTHNITYIPIHTHTHKYSYTYSYNICQCLAYYTHI